MKKSLFAAALGALLGAAGCSTGMSETACAAADWHLVGVNDGAAGHTEASGLQRNEDCFKHGLAADLAAYERGRQEGLFRYCTPDRGYDLGLSGGAYNGACFNHAEGEFLAGFDAGREYKGLRDNVVLAERNLISAENRIKEIDDKLAEMRADWESAKRGEREPIDPDRYDRRIAELIGEQNGIIEDLIDLKVDLRLAERTLEAYEIDLEVERRIAERSGS